MRQSTMIHGIKDIGGFDYDPNNGDSVSFTLFGPNFNNVEFTIWGLGSERAKDFYERNARPKIKKSERELILEAALEKISRGSVPITDIGLVAKEALESDPNYMYIPF